MVLLCVLLVVSCVGIFTGQGRWRLGSAWRLGRLSLSMWFLRQHRHASCMAAQSPRKLKGGCPDFLRLQPGMDTALLGHIYWLKQVTGPSQMQGEKTTQGIRNVLHWGPPMSYTTAVRGRIPLMGKHIYGSTQVESLSKHGQRLSGYRERL